MNESRTLDRADRIGMYMSIVLVAMGAVLAVVAAVERLREVAGAGPIPVLVPLKGETAALPLGPDGAAVDVTVEAATVQVSDPAPATLFALWAQPVWTALVVCAGLVLAALFFLRLARGRAFTRGSVHLVYWATGVVTAGWLGGTILTNMTTNGALSALSDYTYEAVVFDVSLAPALAILLLAAVGGALDIGERLQRDTEGLV